MKSGRVLPWAVVLIGPILACSGLFAAGKTGQHCQSDSDCIADQVCFVDGCGDPGKDLAVEVTPSTRTGAFPQDFRIDELKGTQLLQLFPASTVAGSVTATSAAGDSAPYAGTVGFLLDGQSDLIPGVTRHFQSSVTLNAEGNYTVPVGSGTYTLTATPLDGTLPPRIFPELSVQPGTDVQVDLALPGPDDLTQVTGTVLPLGITASPTPVLSVQAFGPAGEPLSQAVSVAADGGFSLEIPSESASTSIALKVTPLDPGAVLPSASFPVDSVVLPVTLDLGDFGATLSAQGRVVDSSGRPVAGASVRLQGRVTGGGTFHGAAVRSNDAGEFTLPTLASAPGTDFTILIIPPPGDSAGLLAEQLPITPGAAALGDFTCPDRLVVKGSLLLPDGITPAVGVAVEAVPLTPLEPGGDLPSDHTVTTTDGSATFTLALDPGIYRLDFEPTDKLPRLSRFVTVDPDSATAGVITLPDYTLSKGRTVNGHVEILAATDGSAATPVPVAHVRFFRLVDDPDGNPSSVLLDQAYADANGNFTVLLPTR